jgi:hypothetical protein
MPSSITDNIFFAQDAISTKIGEKTQDAIPRCCGMALSTLLYPQGMLTGKDNLDDIIGVVFGLYMCSHPAANFEDLLFFRRGGWHEFSSSRSTFIWLALNMLVLLIGWIVIFLGTTRLIVRVEGVSV